MADLKKAREQINIIDREMAELFEKRMDAVYEVALYKKKTGTKIEDIKREEEILIENVKKIKNKDYAPYYTDFMKSNMRISKAYQSKLINGMSVAISGDVGAFADITAKKVFENASNVAFSDFSSAYKSAESGECDCAFLPLENNFGGDVGAVLDLAFFGSLYINGIFETEIKQNLLAKKDTKTEDIKEIFSHPQALLQCGEFIKKLNVKTKETSNTTVAAEFVAKSSENCFASIGSAETAQVYGLKILKHNINESNLNTTRFAVFSRTPREENANDNRFILMFTVKNEAGALSKAISVIGNYGFNLLSLKSRPTKLDNWEHYFYVEGEGNINSAFGKEMLDKLKNSCSNLKLVGSFQREERV